MNPFRTVAMSPLVQNGDVAETQFVSHLVDTLEIYFLFCSFVLF